MLYRQTQCAPNRQLLLTSYRAPVVVFQVGEGGTREYNSLITFINPLSLGDRELVMNLDMEYEI